MAIGTPADVGNNATTGTAVLSLSITLSAAIAAGSLILVSISNHNSAAVVPDSVTDTAGNTYTLITAANSNAVTAVLAYCVGASALASGDTITVTYASPRHIAMRAYSVSGIVASSAFDVSATQAAGTGTAASVGPTSTTSQADELVFATWAYQNSRTFTAGSGYTAGTADETTSTIRGRVAEWKIVAATGAQTADGTWNTSTTHAGVVATFKAQTSTAKSGSDTATASETASVTPGSRSDTATASDSASIAVAAAVSDTATASDSASIAAQISASDSATLSETASAQNLGTAVGGSETAALAETASVAASVAASDTATASETASVTPGSRSDTATASETASLVVAVGASDGATLSETALAQLLIVVQPSAALTVIVPAEARSGRPAMSLIIVVPAETRSA